MKARLKQVSSFFSLISFCSDIMAGNFYLNEAGSIDFLRSFLEKNGQWRHLFTKIASFQDREDPQKIELVSNFLP